MKRVGYLYEKMCDVDFIKKAIKNAAKGKTDRLYVKAILSDIDGYAQKLKAMLETETVKLSPNEHIEIYDRSCSKTRKITIPKFYPDQIVHWLIITAAQPVITRGMYRYCCGSIPNRGGIDAKAYVETAIRDEKMRYVAKLDVSKFLTVSARLYCSICLNGKSKTTSFYVLSDKSSKTAAIIYLSDIIRRNGFQISTWRV